jgi:DNA-directed RNA polymerase subunit RPC12/RpoP
LEPRVRNAALIAAIRTGALACAAAVFMGFVLVCSLGGLLPGGYTLGLGRFVALIGVPVSIVGAVSTYRQTLETERHPVGLCPRCGYDLRGSMGMRCPECGRRITAPGSTKSHLTDEEQRQQDMLS